MADDETRLTVRLSPDDERRIQRLLADMALQSRSDLVRHALAELAKARGLETAVQLHRTGATT